MYPKPLDVAAYGLVESLTNSWSCEQQYVLTQLYLRTGTSQLSEFRHTHFKVRSLELDTAPLSVCILLEHIPRSCIGAQANPRSLDLVPNTAGMKSALLLLLPLSVAALPTGQETLSPSPPPVGTLDKNITTIAGGSIPNVSQPLILSSSAQVGFQLLQFLEILEVYLYYEGLQNFTTGVYSTSGFPNDTIEVVTKTAAVSI